MSSNQTFRGVVPLEQGAKIHEFDTTTVTSGSSVDVASHTVTAGKILKLTQVDVSCSVEGLAEVFAGATRIAVLRIGNANKNATQSWSPTKSIAAGVILKVTFTAIEDTGPEVEALIQGAEF